MSDGGSTERTPIDDEYLTDPRRGGLTPEDREYLRGEGELTEGSEYNARRRIRERIHDSMLDFSVLMEWYAENEELIREALDTEESAVEQAMVDAIAMLFCAVTTRLNHGGRTPGRVNPEFDGVDGYQSAEFLWLLAGALDRAYLENDIVFEGGELHVEATRLPNLKTIRRQVEEGETLHPNLAALLLKSGEIDPEAFTEFAREEILDEE